MSQFPLATTDGVGAETGDTRKQGNAATTVLLGKETNDKPARTLVGNREQVVEGTMMLGSGAFWLFSTGPAVTAVNRRMLTVLVHNPLPPLGDRRGW